MTERGWLIGGLVVGSVLLVGAMALSDPCRSIRRSYLKERSLGLRATSWLMQARRMNCGWAQGVER